MIHLYLVCHGAADERSSTPDGVQALTAKGRKRFHKAARALSRYGEKLDAILTSPLVRAVQTAEILASEVRHGEVAVLGELAPGQAADALLRTVSKRVGKSGSVALVGQAPQLSSVLASLAHLSPAQASHLALKTGTVVRIDASGLPAAKSVEPKWWLKARSGARKKGLPLPKAEVKSPAAGKPKAKPAGEKKEASRPKPKARKIATRSKARAPLARAAPRVAGRIAKVAPHKAPAPAQPEVDTARPREESPRPAPQKFMGSPRPATPPPRPASPPPAAPAAPASPSEVSPASSEPSPDES